MPPAGFEPASPTSERPQTHALDRAAAETGIHYEYTYKLCNKYFVVYIVNNKIVVRMENLRFFLT